MLTNTRFSDTVSLSANIKGGCLPTYPPPPKKLGQCLHDFVFLVEEILIISNFANGPLWGLRYILLQLRPQIAVSELWFYGSGTFCGHQRQSVEQYFLSQTDPPQWYIYDIMTILRKKQPFNFLKVWKKKCCFCSYPALASLAINRE